MRTPKPKLLAVLFAAILMMAACGASDSEDSSTADDGFGAPAAEGEGDEAASSDEAGAERSARVAADAEEGVATDATTAAAAEAADSDAPATTIVSEADTESPIEEQEVQAGTLTAAEIDDNLNFEFFNSYLERLSVQFGGGNLPLVQLGDRIAVEVTGSGGDGVANARVEIEGGQQQAVAYTNPTGTAYVFPTQWGLGGWDSLDVRVTGPDGQGAETFSIGAGDIADDGTVAVTMEDVEGGGPAALDLALVIDTTGSMGDELRYLTTEFTSIVGRLAELHPNVDLRFALVVYRDEGDDYVTQTYDFTGNVSEIQGRLAEQSAEGGGDYPEALDTALAEANGLSWRSGDVARVLLLNADAPPHDSGFANALNAGDQARANGIRIYPLAASGVGDTAEYLMRVLAASTGGRHLFLTDDSGVGLAHQEPKVQCYVVSRLDHLLLRILRSEVSGERLEPIPEQLIRTVGTYDAGHCSDAG